MDQADLSAQLIWSYMKLDHDLSQADLILVCGSNDIRSDKKWAILGTNQKTCMIMQGC